MSYKIEKWTEKNMENKEDKRWYRFMSTDQWVVFINIMRILTFVLIAALIWILWSNIEQVKLLANDPCRVCMNKTGANCIKFIR